MQRIDLPGPRAADTSNLSELKANEAEPKFSRANPHKIRGEWAMTEYQSPKSAWHERCRDWPVGTAVRYRKPPENAGSQALLFRRGTAANKRGLNAMLY